MTKENKIKFSEEFIKESEEVDEFDLPEWWDEALIDNKEELSKKDEIKKGDYTRWL